MTLEVDTEALRIHARHVDGLAEQISEAVDAGATMALQWDAFGLLCSFLVPITTTVQMAGVAALGTAALTTKGIAGALDLTADGYDTVDDATRGGLTSLVRMLPS